MVSAAIRAVGIAASAQDEKALRVELRRLAEESLLLASQPELLRTPLASRQRIAIERDRTPRAGSG
jgi:stage V sporulation protein SpoVS